MGLFQRTLDDAEKAYDEGKWDEVIKILEEHANRYINRSKQMYGMIDRMIDTLTRYKNFVNTAIQYAKEKKVGTYQQIHFAGAELQQLKSDIRKMIKEGRVEVNDLR
jgi:hypothetical protein